MKRIYVVYNRKIDRIMAAPANAYTSSRSAKGARTSVLKGNSYDNPGNPEDYEIMEIEIK